MKAILFFLLALIIATPLMVSPGYLLIERFYVLFFLGGFISCIPVFFLLRYIVKPEAEQSVSETGRNRFLRVIPGSSKIFISLLFTIFCGGYASVFLNGKLDTSTAYQHSSKVLKIEKVNRNWRARWKSSPRFYTRVHFNNPEDEESYLDLDEYDFPYETLMQGEQEITLDVHQGFLGFIWYSHVTIERSDS